MTPAPRWRWPKPRVAAASSSWPHHPARWLAEHATGRWTTLLPTSTGDQLATAVAMLSFLDQVQLGPSAEPESVSEALDAVAIACSPNRDISINPAKMLAISLADAAPLVWGGSVLASAGRAPDRRVDPAYLGAHGARR